MPTPSNDCGRERLLLSRRVDALGAPTDHNHVGPKLLIHDESCTWIRNQQPEVRHDDCDRAKGSVGDSLLMWE